LTEHLIEQLGYVGIGLILILGGLGLPIPEEAPIIIAAVLSRNGHLTAPLALASCLVGVLLGDLVVYFLGFFYGEKVLSLPVTRRLLTRQREAQIKGYFHRHGFKILVSGRFVPGFRTAAYLTAGILKLPTLKLLLTDLVAASLSTCFMFGLGFAFAHQIQKGIREVQQWVIIITALSVAIWLLVRYYKARDRAGLPIGPPVLDSDDVPLPNGDIHPTLRHPSAAAVAAVAPAETAARQSASTSTEPAKAVETPADGVRPPIEARPATAARRFYEHVAVDVEPGRAEPRAGSPA
jgi:membrane protein DedA with SNARE-associated domain